VWYSDVDCALLTDVYNVYRHDFEMFDYSADEFFRLCKRSEVDS
jgi:hypothetical protein